MTTNLALDDDELLEEAFRIGGRATREETVHEALREYVERRKRLRALDAFGSFDLEPHDDSKARRRK